jgi:hypothetical protein
VDDTSNAEHWTLGVPVRRFGRGWTKVQYRMQLPAALLRVKGAKHRLDLCNGSWKLPR